MSQHLDSRLSWNICVLVCLLVVALATLTTPAYGYDDASTDAPTAADAATAATLGVHGNGSNAHDSEAALELGEALKLGATSGRLNYDDRANLALHANATHRESSVVVGSAPAVYGPSPTSSAELHAPRQLDEAVGALCSFTGTTAVLMADGTSKPLADVKVGDWVLAEDPETGERGAREVTHLWIHDDTVVDLNIDGDSVTTTEDHPFWNVADRQWQRADALDAGDRLLTAEGNTVVVARIDAGSARTTIAYNLTVDDIHTFFVVVGDDEILVHNTCPTGSQLWGKSFDEVGDLIPEGWVKSPTTGPGGARYANPARPGEQVRVMPGNPADPNPLKRGPYARISTGGQVSDPIPLHGNPNL